MAKEIRKILDTAVRGFSLRRSVGKHEEDDDADDMSDGSDDDQSLDFLDASDATSKMLGPYIPTERRMVLSQIIQKMAGLMKEKRNTKINIMMQWRLARLTQKISQLRSHNLGYMLLTKVFDKRRNSFYRIAEFGSVRKVSPVSTLTNINIPGSPNIDMKKAFESNIK